MTTRGLFVGIGIDIYDDESLLNLDHAVADVTAVAELLADEFDGQPLINAELAKVATHLRSIKDAATGNSLVLLWSGHGHQDKDEELLLATSDDADGLAAREVIRQCGRSGANQLLLILDTCRAGATILDSAAVLTRLTERLTSLEDHAWFGILVSCSAADTGARDGTFGSLLVKLLKKGPQSPDQQRRWSRYNELIRGDDLGQALLEEWQGTDQIPRFFRGGKPAGQPRRDARHCRDQATYLDVDQGHRRRGGAAAHDRRRQRFRRRHRAVDRRDRSRPGDGRQRGEPFR